MKPIYKLIYSLLKKELKVLYKYLDKNQKKKLI